MRNLSIRINELNNGIIKWNIPELGKSMIILPKSKDRRKGSIIDIKSPKDCPKVGEGAIQTSGQSKKQNK